MDWLKEDVVVVAFSALLGYFLGNLKSDRDHTISRFRDAASQLFTKAWEFTDAKSLIIQKGYGKVAQQADSLFQNLFHSFYGNTLFFPDGIYQEISKGLNICRDYLRDEQCYSEPESDKRVRGYVFWKWYENEFYEWLKDVLKQHYHQKWWKLCHCVKPCPKRPVWLEETHSK